MKVGEFQKAINANSTSYSGFMSQNGAFKGAGSTVYQDAWAFFKKRELRGVPAPKKRAKTVAGASGPDVDISDVQLEGEMEDRVPVYGIERTGSLREAVQITDPNRHVRRDPP
jgi:hypothetical protein